MSLQDNVAGIRLTGGCVGCPSSKLTMFHLVEPLIKEVVGSDIEIILVE